MPSRRPFPYRSQACVLLLAASCGSLPPADKAGPSGPPLKANALAAGSETWRSGDLIFRRGEGIASQAVLAADPRSPFSHVGLFVRSPQGAFVVSALPAEGSATGSVRSDPLARFLAPESATAIAVYRLRGEPERARRAAEVALGWATRRLPFDDRFDLETPDRVYCTELVRNAYRAAGLDLVDGRLDRLDLPLRSGLYLLPSRLQASRHLELIQTNDPGDTDTP